MRRSVLSVLPSFFVLLLSACSLVVDFPARPDADIDDDDDERDAAAMDARVDERDAAGDSAARDGGRDARVDAERPEAGGAACGLADHRGCESDELCCDRKDGKGPVCVATSDNECSVCGEACILPGRPHCGGRVCECRPGSGSGCPGDQTCMGSGASARCVECTTRAQCDDGELCENNRCVQCSRGADADSVADDEGCGGSTPICGANGTCTACSTSPNNCPSGQQCVRGIGCVGCNPAAPLRSNGCSRTTPVCRPAGTMFQCSACESNADCQNGFCDRASGACTNVCDPQAPVGANQCASGTPVCKPAGNDFQCAACTAADCTGGRLCATEGPQAGNCVQCRNNADCPASAPTCNRTSGTCTTCAGGTVFDNASGRCVECTSDAACSAEKGGAYCHPTQKECVPCGELPTPDAACMMRSAATPRCGAAGLCIGCTTDAQCATTPATPLCVAGSCAACTSVTPTDTADGRCRTISTATPICLTSGANAGRCTLCDPMGDRGCMAPTSQCERGAGNALSCVACIAGAGEPDDGCAAAAPVCVDSETQGRACAVCDPGALPNGCPLTEPFCQRVGGSGMTRCVLLPDGGDGGTLLPPIL